MSGKNPFLGLGFGSPFTSFSRTAAVALSKIIIGSRQHDTPQSNAGAVYVYDLDGTNELKLTASDAATDDYFGRGVAIGSGKIVVGAASDDDNGNYNSGSVYVYDLDGTGEFKITASDSRVFQSFGRVLAVGDSKIVIGVTGENSSAGAVYIYNLDGTGEIKLSASDAAGSDYFGSSVAVGDGKIVVGAYGEDSSGTTDGGSAYIYNLDGTGEIKITASDVANSDNFGYSVAVGNSKVVVGSPYDDDAGSVSGSAYIYNLDGTGEIKITSPDDHAYEYFGQSVAVGNSKVVVGCPMDDAGSQVGAVYVFDLDGTSPIKLTASDGSGGDRLGGSVAIAGNKVVAGASGEDDRGSNAGAAYIFDLDTSSQIKLTASDGAGGDLYGDHVAAG